LASALANLSTFQLIGMKGLGLSEDADISAIPEINSGKPSEGLVAYLLDDLNTSAAILTHLFSLVRGADQKGDVREEPARQLLVDCRFLGLDPFRGIREQRAAYKAHRNPQYTHIEGLVEARNVARKTKDFKKADEIRDQLRAMSVELEDRKDGKT